MMKYRVLVVDDEPIILSGISHLMDWAEADSEIIGTAGNGAEAYSIIEREHPDIVITDIRMPVMDGLALAGKCSEEYPDIVFIILTSLTEFGLAREAIGYGISDYLLKTELDGTTLRKALEKAGAERDRRREQFGGYSAQSDDAVPSAVSSLFIMRDITPETRSFLAEQGMLTDYAFIAFVFSFPSPSLEKQWRSEDYYRLHEWEKDIIEKILQSSFSSFHPVIPVAGKAGTFVYFINGISPGTWTAVSSRLGARVASASSMVTGLSPELLTTPVFSGLENLKEARAVMERNLAAHYLSRSADDIHLRPLDVDTVFPKLEKAIAGRDAVSSRASFAMIRKAMVETDHSLSQFTFMVAALRSAVSSGLSEIGLSGDSSLDVYDAVDFISRRTEALSFIDDASSSLLTLLDSMSGIGGNVADKAREYVLMHVSEKISLGDVADYACVSPGYMSKSFKRIMGISLVDYINQMKIEKAKEMMKEGREDRIADIALSLGFRNIYYFSKVFRKVEGIPPTEYMKKL